MKILILIICGIMMAVTSYSQINPALRNASHIDEVTRKEIFKKIIANKSKADFPNVYDAFNDSTKIIRIVGCWFVIEKTDSISFNKTIMKYIKAYNRPFDNDYILYNMKPDGGYYPFGGYIDYEGPPQIHPSGLTKGKNFLDAAAKYCNIDSVTFLTITGVEGNIVLIDDDLWIIDGNTMTDLVSYLKEHYKSIDAFRKKNAVHP